MRHRWTQWEIAYLNDHAEDGAEAIAENLGRSVKSVVNAASRYRISLRKKWWCPRCSRYTYTPLSEKWGWCRTCCIQESHDRAVVKYKQVMRDIAEEKARVLQAKRARQCVYSDTERKKRELRKLRAERERNEKRRATC